MRLWNNGAKLCVAAAMTAGALALAACESGGGDRYRAKLGWVAPEGDDAGWKREPRREAPPPPPRQEARQPAPRPAQPAMGGDVMYLPTGDRNTSALSLRCSMPREVIAGTNFTYDMEVCNLTGTTLNNVMVSYSLDGGRVVNSDPAMGQGGFPVGDLAPRQCRTIRITATPAGTNAVRGCAGATWNNALCCATNVVQPALKLVKSVTPESGTPCDTFTYRVVVTNTGSGAASNVRITDNFPAGVTVDGKNTVTVDAGTLAAGQSREFTFPARVDKTGTFNNEATAAADNNLSAKSNAVAFTVRAPVLQIAKACPGNLRIGRPAEFRITVTNKGDAPATNVVVEDTLPADTAFGGASDGGAAQGNRVVWNLGTLAPGASKEVRLTANIRGQGNIQNTATARAACAQAVSANCWFAVQGAPDMRTALDDAEGVEVVGANHEYIYSVGNQGQVPLTNVTCKITLPAGLQFVSAEAGLNPKVEGQVQTYSLGTLAPGQNRTFRFTVKGTKAGEMLAISETTCTELKTPVRDDEITVFVE